MTTISRVFPRDVQRALLRIQGEEGHNAAARVKCEAYDAALEKLSPEDRAEIEEVRLGLQSMFHGIGETAAKAIIVAASQARVLADKIEGEGGRRGHEIRRGA